MTLAESDPNDRIRCLVHILPAEGAGSQYCARANNLINYMEVNRDVSFYGLAFIIAIYNVHQYTRLLLDKNHTCLWSLRTKKLSSRLPLKSTPRLR